MDKILKNYYTQVKHLSDEKVRARFLLELLTVEKDAILGFQDNDKRYDTLDEALDRFYRLKEYRFAKSLLENYLLTGNFELAVEKQDIVHRLENFRQICDTLSHFFPSVTSIAHKN